MSFLKTRSGIVFIGFFVIAGYILITEHGTHIAPYLPWLILLACPLMHVFMHHGHGSHNHQPDNKKITSDEGDDNQPVQQGGYDDGDK